MLLVCPNFIGKTEKKSLIYLKILFRKYNQTSQKTIENINFFNFIKMWERVVTWHENDSNDIIKQKEKGLKQEVAKPLFPPDLFLAVKDGNFQVYNIS